MTRNITCAAELKLAILETRFEQTVQGELLKEELLNTFESLKPVSIIKNTLS